MGHHRQPEEDSLTVIEQRDNAGVLWHDLGVEPPEKWTPRQLAIVLKDCLTNDLLGVYVLDKLKAELAKRIQQVLGTNRRTSYSLPILMEKLEIPAEGYSTLVVVISRMITENQAKMSLAAGVLTLTSTITTAAR